MNMKRVQFILALVALVLTVVAITAQASTLAQRRAYSWIFTHAACQGPYWSCSNTHASCTATGVRVVGVAAWKCTVYTFRNRRHGGGDFQSCNGHVNFDYNMHVSRAALTCFAVSQNSSDNVTSQT